MHTGEAFPMQNLRRIPEECDGKQGDLENPIVIMVEAV